LGSNPLISDVNKDTTIALSKVLDKFEEVIRTSLRAFQYSFLNYQTGNEKKCLGKLYSHILNNSMNLKRTDYFLISYFE